MAGHEACQTLLAHDALQLVQTNSGTPTTVTTQLDFHAINIASNPYGRHMQSTVIELSLKRHYASMSRGCSNVLVTAVKHVVKPMHNVCCILALRRGT
jgi:hypothetical protein